MEKIQTYSISKLPIIIVALFLSLFIILSWSHYNHSVELTFEHAHTDLKDTALRLSRTLEYDLASNDNEQAQREIASFYLQENVEFAVLINPDQTVAMASDFGWQGQRISSVLPELSEHYINQNSSDDRIILLQNGSLLTAIAPVVDKVDIAGSQIRSHKRKSLILRINLEPVINETLSEILSETIPALITLLFVALFLIWLVNRFILKPLHILGDLTQHIKEGRGNLTNPFQGNTEQNKVAQALVDSANHIHQQFHEIQIKEQRLNVTLQSIGDAVIVTDNKGNITLMNPVAEQLTHWSLADAMGESVKTIFPIIDASTRETIKNPVDKVIETGTTVYLSNHTTLIAKDGTEYQIADSAAPIRDVDGTILGMILVFNDVTEQYKLRSSLEQERQVSRNIIDSSPDLIFLKDIDGVYLRCNKAFEIFFGASEGDIIGKTDFDFVDMEMASFFRENDKAMLNKGVNQINEETVIYPDGRKVLLETLKIPFNTSDGIAAGILGISHDITNERSDKLALAQKEQEQSEILNTLSDGVITIDETGMILSYNKAAEQLFGYNQGEALNQNINILMPEPISGQHREYLENYLHSEHRNPMIGAREVTGKRKNNTTFPLRITLAELSRAADGTHRFIGSCHDLTQIKAQQAQIQRTQKMDALGKLVGGIAHDYNNMLGVILGYTDLMTMKYAHVEGLNKYTENIAKAGERGKSLTKRMLAFSKQSNAEAQAIKIETIFKQQKELLSKSVTALIKLKYPETETSWLIWVDPNELQDSLLNLTINAQYAMPEGGTLTFATETAHLSASDASLLGLAENDYLKLSVTDTGCGIDDDVLNKIFDPFFTTKGGNGTGLGLSQVYGFMERTGGTVKVSSTIGVGSRFTLYFPRYKGEVINDLKQDTLPISKQGHGKTILVVDDEPALRELAEEILIMAGYRVLIAKDGINATDILATHTVDLVLSDVIMPNMDGYQLAEHIKKNHPKVKVQLATGFSDNRHSTVTNQTLHNTVLHKPYHSSDLLKQIGELLQDTQADDL